MKLVSPAENGPTRVTMRLLLSLLLLLLLTVSAESRTRLDTNLVMDDVQLAVSLFTPDEAPPASGFPAILSVHGYAGSRQGNVARAAAYADKGYVAMTVSVRGEGGVAGSADASGGVIDWMTDGRVIEDMRELVDWLGNRPNIRADRIGMEGISQGGLITWASAIEGLPIRCAVTLASAPRFATTITHNGANNYFIATLTRLAKNTGLVRSGPFLDSMIAAYDNDNHQELIRLAASREIFDKVEQISIPMFAQLAWQDDLFSARDLFTTFDRVTSPMILFLVPGGHSSSGPSELRYWLEIRFWNRWLKDDMNETIMHPDSVVRFIDPATDRVIPFDRMSFERNIPRPGEQNPVLPLYFQSGGRLATTPPTTPFTLTAAYLQNITNQSHIFRSEPLEVDRVLTGGELSLLASSNAATWQVNILLFDYDPDENRVRQITRGAWQARDGGAERELTYRLSDQFYTVPKGHAIEAHIRFGMPLVKPEIEFGKAPVAPRASSINRVRGTAEHPAVLRLFLPEGTTGVERAPALPGWLELW